MVREATSIFGCMVLYRIALWRTLPCSNPVPGLGIIDFIGFLRKSNCSDLKYHYINCDFISHCNLFRDDTKSDEHHC